MYVCLLLFVHVCVSLSLYVCMHVCMIESGKSFPQFGVSSLDSERDDCYCVALAFVCSVHFRVQG